MASIKILYFAALGEQLNSRTEDFTLTEDIQSIQDLKNTLAKRGESWEAILASDIRSAVNQTICTQDKTISPQDEIAFFPPVTGG